MSKGVYRTVKVTEPDKSVHFVVEKKRLFGWRAEGYFVHDYFRIEQYNTEDAAVNAVVIFLTPQKREVLKTF